MYKGMRVFEEGLKARGGPFWLGKDLTTADIALSKLTDVAILVSLICSKFPG